MSTDIPYKTEFRNLLCLSLKIIFTYFADFWDLRAVSSSNVRSVFMQMKMNLDFYFQESNKMSSQVPSDLAHILISI